MINPILTLHLSEDGSALVGEERTVQVDDRDWEGHLIEGPWVHRQNGRYHLFYARNDCATADYGIGVAAHPFGPYAKRPASFLQSSQILVGAGPCLGRARAKRKAAALLPCLLPGITGSYAFRALLTTRLEFGPGGVITVAALSD